MEHAEKFGVWMFSSDGMMCLIQNHAAEHVQKDLTFIEHVHNSTSSCHKNIVHILVEVPNSLQCLVLTKDIEDSQASVGFNRLDGIYQIFYTGHLPVLVV